MLRAYLHCERFRARRGASLDERKVCQYVAQLVLLRPAEREHERAALRLPPDATLRAGARTQVRERMRVSRAERRRRAGANSARSARMTRIGAQLYDEGAQQMKRQRALLSTLHVTSAGSRVEYQVRQKTARAEYQVWQKTAALSMKYGSRRRALSISHRSKRTVQMCCDGLHVDAAIVTGRTNIVIEHANSTIGHTNSSAYERGVSSHSLAEHLRIRLLVLNEAARLERAAPLFRAVDQ